MCIEISTSQIAPEKHRKHILERTVVWVSKSSGVLDPRKSHSFVRQRVSLVTALSAEAGSHRSDYLRQPEHHSGKSGKGGHKEPHFSHLLCIIPRD